MVRQNERETITKYLSGNHLPLRKSAAVKNKTAYKTGAFFRFRKLFFCCFYSEAIG